MKVDTYVTETCKMNYKEPMVFNDTFANKEASEKSNTSLGSSLTKFGTKLGKNSSKDGRRKLTKQGSAAVNSS